MPCCFSECWVLHLVGIISLLSMMHGTTNIKLIQRRCRRVERKNRNQNRETDTVDLYLIIQFNLGLCLHYITGSNNMNFRQTRPTVFRKYYHSAYFDVRQFCNMRVRTSVAITLWMFCLSRTGRCQVLPKSLKITSPPLNNHHPNESQSKTEQATNTTYTG